MIYFDTNVLIYAFCKNVDDQEQKNLSQKMLKNAISNAKLLLSEVVLYEFAFISKKLEEDESVINQNLQFLSHYCKPIDIKNDVMDMMMKVSAYKQSFDVYHICFSDYFQCEELVTFDSGFKKFKAYAKTNIKIL